MNTEKKQQGETKLEENMKLDHVGALGQFLNSRLKSCTSPGEELSEQYSKTKAHTTTNAVYEVIIHQTN